MEILKRLPDTEFYALIYRACSCQRFANEVTSLRPYESLEGLLDVCDSLWMSSMGEEEWKESFRAHPRIGDREQLRKKVAGMKSMEGDEQAGAASANEDVLDGLERGNREYEEKFGFIFLICASGKSGDEMLSALLSRLQNSPKDEIVVAAGEQAKITRLRVTKFIDELHPVSSKL